MSQILFYRSLIFPALKNNREERAGVMTPSCRRDVTNSTTGGRGGGRGVRPYINDICRYDVSGYKSWVLESTKHTPSLSGRTSRATFIFARTGSSEVTLSLFEHWIRYCYLEIRRAPRAVGLERPPWFSSSLRVRVPHCQ